MASRWLTHMMHDDAGLRPVCQSIRSSCAWGNPSPFLRLNCPLRRLEVSQIHHLPSTFTCFLEIRLPLLLWISTICKKCFALPPKCWKNHGQWHSRWPKWKSRPKQTRDEVSAMLVELGSMSTFCFVICAIHRDTFPQKSYTVTYRTE